MLRRILSILALAVLAAAGTYAYVSRQPNGYRASARIYLGQGSQVQSQLDSRASTPLSAHAVADEVALINSGALGHVRGAPSGTVSARAVGASDLIELDARARSARAARALADAYGAAYLAQRRASYVSTRKAAVSSLRAHLVATEKRRASPTKQLQVADLVSEINALDLEISLGDGGDRQLAPAHATGGSPPAVRDAAIAAAAAILLATLLTLAIGGRRRRLPSVVAVESALGGPALAVLPPVRRSIVRVDGQRHAAPALQGPLADLRGRLSLGAQSAGAGHAQNGNGHLSSPRTIAFVSAGIRDGKSNALAAFALAACDAGERVVIVETDLRRPVQAELLGAEGAHGLIEVLDGTLTIREAMQLVRRAAAAREAEPSGSGGAVATALREAQEGEVRLLASGGTVANPASVLGGTPMSVLLRTMAAHFDHVLVDVPPFLSNSDASALLALVDGTVAVVRIGHSGEAAVRRLAALVRRSGNAPLLGAVVTDASAEDCEEFAAQASYGRSLARNS